MQRLADNYMYMQSQSKKLDWRRQPPEREMSRNYVTVHVTGTSALDITVARTPQIPVATVAGG